MPSLNNASGEHIPEVLIKWSQEQEHTLTLKYPLHRACRDGELSTLNNLLLSMSSNMDRFLQVDQFCGWPPAMWAAFFGQLECLERVLPAALVGVRSSSGLTALHVAALGDKPNCLHWLLKLGVSHHLTDGLGETALHKAARSRSHECSGLLAVCGADFSVRNNDGFTPAQLSEMSGNGFLHTNGKHDGDSIKTSSQSAVCHISTNGYYGYQSVAPNKNGSSNGHDESAMEEDTVPCECTNGQNGFTNPYSGYGNGYSGFTNGFSGLTNGHHINGHTNNNGFADMNGRKRSSQDTIQYSYPDETIKKMRHEEPAPFEQAVVPASVPSAVPSTSTFSNKRCEMSYPRCMMGHYM